MKKKIMLFTLMLTLLSTNVVLAKDSAVLSGRGFQVIGSINDTSISGSVTGEGTRYATASITNAYYYNGSGKSIKAPNISGSPYVSYYIGSAGEHPWKWNRAIVTGKHNGSSVSTRVLVN